MNAKTQYKLSAADLEIVLAVLRGGTLQAAGERLSVDSSTIFRSLQRIERGLGQQLFARARTGYLPLELAHTLAAHAEGIEVALEQARSSADVQGEEVAGMVRISTTDGVLHSMITPALQRLQQRHPLLSYELQTSNEMVNLSRRDADIAIRATKKPPENLIGKRVASIDMALYAAKETGLQCFEDLKTQPVVWIGLDEAISHHPSVLWRQRHFPKIIPTYQVSSMVTILEMVARGMGVGILPTMMAKHKDNLIALTDTLKECQSELWLLTHPESRHLRRVSTVYSFLAEALAEDSI